MDTAPMRMIELERDGDTLVLTPLRDLRELDYQEIEAERDELMLLLERDQSVKNVVVDFCRTDYFGSTFLGVLAWLWQVVRGRHGRMALRHVSAHEREILTVTGLAGLWPITGDREEAAEAATGRPSPRQ